MSCFSCGRLFSGSVNELLQKYKQEYLTDGVERYFYREEEKGDVKIIKKDKFKLIYETKIQPNFPKGAEYAHIQEYKAN